MNRGVLKAKGLIEYYRGENILLGIVFSQRCKRRQYLQKEKWNCCHNNILFLDKYPFPVRKLQSFTAHSSLFSMQLKKGLFSVSLISVTRRERNSSVTQFFEIPRVRDRVSQRERRQSEWCRTRFCSRVEWPSLLHFPGSENGAIIALIRVDCREKYERETQSLLPTRREKKL